MKKILFLLGCFLAVNANAAIINSIDEATVANGTHTHSTNGGFSGVGYWFSEESRAVVEFDTSSITGNNTGTLSFDLSTPGGLCCGQSQNYLGDFNIYAFEGDGTVSNADYFLTNTLLGTSSALGLSVGDTIFIDISAFLTTFSSNNLGIVFDPLGANSGRLAQETVFNNFQIDSISSVPEPATLALLGLGLAGIGFSQKKKQLSKFNILRKI